MLANSLHFLDQPPRAPAPLRPHSAIMSRDYPASPRRYTHEKQSFLH